MVAGTLVAPAHAGDVTVFAAASLSDAIRDVAEMWESQTGGDVTLSFAGSSAIARQVQAGAPADVVVLASVEWMDALDQSGDLAPGARLDLLTNRLVVVGGWHEEGDLDLTSASEFVERLGRGRLAMALVDAVPAGIYARAALENLGLWEAVADRVVQSDNVRGALALVAVRAATLGVVYATDAQVERRIEVIAEIPVAAHPPIVYPAAVTRGGDHADAHAFLVFLNSPFARAIFTGHGFGLVGDR